MNLCRITTLLLHGSITEVHKASGRLVSESPVFEYLDNDLKLESFNGVCYSDKLTSPYKTHTLFGSWVSLLNYYGIRKLWKQSITGFTMSHSMTSGLDSLTMRVLCIESACVSYEKRDQVSHNLTTIKHNSAETQTNSPVLAITE